MKALINKENVAFRLLANSAVVTFDGPLVIVDGEQILNDGGMRVIENVVFPGPYVKGKWRCDDGFWVDHLANQALVPETVGMAEARKALILAGIGTAAVYAAIDAIPDATARALALADWDYQNNVRRDSPLVASLAPALGLDADQVDQLFIAAKQLEK